MYNMQNAEYDPTHTPYAAIFPVVVYAKEHPPYDSAEVKTKSRTTTMVFRLPMGPCICASRWLRTRYNCRARWRPQFARNGQCLGRSSKSAAWSPSICPIGISTFSRGICWTCTSRLQTASAYRNQHDVPMPRISNGSGSILSAVRRELFRPGRPLPLAGNAVVATRSSHVRTQFALPTPYHQKRGDRPASTAW
jgi:hypothetical protein